MDIAKAIPKPDFMGEAEWDLLMKTRNREIIRLGSRPHVDRYIETKGGSDEHGDTYITQGGPTCLVGTTGRRSGKEQISPANFLQDGDDVFVVGSIAGIDRHPYWALNLEANPEAWIQVKADRWSVTAHKMVGEERSGIWPRLTEFFPLWGHFQNYCDREFMVFRLTPREESK
jgi:deazaflavin-dependent oxidoreductase (nitroreductase family)